MGSVGCALWTGSDSHSHPPPENRSTQWCSQSLLADRGYAIDLHQDPEQSVSGFHHHFKAVTAMSPLQFQKQLRLQEARRLMLGEDLDAMSPSPLQPAFPDESPVTYDAIRGDPELTSHRTPYRRSSAVKPHSPGPIGPGPPERQWHSDGYYVPNTLGPRLRGLPRTSVN